MDKKQVKPMGFWSMLLFGITAIIGSGIFLLPSSGVQLIGVASIFVLLFDALLVISIALCFAKAATYFDRDGGPYLYAKEAFGNFVGFEVGFVTWAIRLIAQATMAVAFTTALGSIFPYFATQTGKMLVASILIIGLSATNIAGVNLSKILINTVTVAKLLPLILFVAVGIFFIEGNNFNPMFPGGEYVSGSFGQAAVTLFYAFTGFEGIVVAAGDMENPKKNLPKVIFLSILVVSLFYVLIQVVSIGILGPEAAAASSVPIQDAFERVAGGFGKALISAGTLLSTGGLLISSVYLTPRSGSALAENGMLPAVVAKRNRFNAPYVAIIISAIIVLAIAWSGTFSSLAMISAISRFAQYIPTCLAVLVFAKTKKEVTSSFTLPFGWFIPVLALLVSSWLLFQVSGEQLLWGLGALLVAVPFYFVTGSYKK
ncbi:APC family permease [Streptococcus hyovaginalis]|uniref:APC family permease n=1 Tax=Streptococcus hyovaginalis TaxID=149015 RepID=UPI002A808015|nr:APC family permease [Streptococcus hyovaginalis]MDY4511177.1 APC family permease [Streptococcus hyovaginalis]